MIDGIETVTCTLSNGFLEPAPSHEENADNDTIVFCTQQRNKIFII